MKTSMQFLQTALEPLVRHVRPATESDQVAGVQPQCVVEPENEEDVAAVLAFADREGLKVLTRGSGTQEALGFPPRGGDILLRTARMNQIIEHAPHDLTVSVQAGLPLSTLQETLATTRQWLALDPDLAPDATMGGIIATNASGASRLRYGGVRDQIIGIRVVLPDGTVAKGGGKVVKNVAGYDLPKLFTGSLGTLGVIVSATFRLYPLAPTSRTVLLTSSHLDALCGLAVRVIGSTLVPAIIDIMGSTSQRDIYTMAVRFEMDEQAAVAQCATLVEMAKSSFDGVLQQQDQLAGEAEAHFWSQASLRIPPAEHGEGTEIMVKASLLPTDVAAWLKHLQDVSQRSNMTTRWRAHAGHGIVFARLAGDDAALVAAVDELREAARQHQGSLTLQQCPPHLGRQIDVWGPSSALDTMRLLKSRFDPNNTLNPGRFVGGI